MTSYFYKGRHRKPTDHGKRIAAVASGAILSTAIPIAAASPAQAAQSAPRITAPNATLAAIAFCESGGNIRAQNATSTASGKYQFINATWRSVGGTGRARDASEAEQDARALALLMRDGTTPWNPSKSCWAKRVAASNPSTSGSTTSANAPRRTADAVVKATPKPTAPTTAPAPATRGVRSVVVRRGDTLSGIAATNRISGGWQSLYAKNRNTVANPNLIFPGQRITLS